MTALKQIAPGQAYPEVPQNENFETLSASAIFGKKQSVTGGLVWGYYGGLYLGNTIPDGTVTLADASTNYVVVLRSTGVVSVSTSTTNGSNALYARLYAVTTSGGLVTAVVDQRQDTNGLLLGGGGGGGSLDTDPTMAANSDTVAASQKATRTYIKSITDAWLWKAPVRVAASANVNLSSDAAAGSVVNGVTLATGDRILFPAQTTGSENGIYVVNATGAPTRASDADSGAELVNATVEASEGSLNADATWQCKTNAPITVGTTATVWGQVGGGGGLANFTDNLNTVSPNNTIPVNYFAVVNSATDVDVGLPRPKGYGSLILGVSDNSASGGQKRGFNAIDLQLVRSNSAQIANGTEAIAIGSRNTSACIAIGADSVSTNPGSIAIGNGMNALGTNSVCIGGYNGPSVSGAGSASIAGYAGTVTGPFAVKLGGNSCNIGSAGYGGVTLGGESISVNGKYGVAAGFNSTADAFAGIACGNGGLTRGINSSFAHGVAPRQAQGDSQFRRVGLVGNTNGATTSIVLTSDRGGAGGSNQIFVPTNYTLVFTGKVAAMSGAGSGGWIFSGTIKNFGGFGFVGTPTVTPVGVDSGLGSPTVTLALDTTNNCLQIQVTSSISNYIAWVCFVDYIECG